MFADSKFNSRRLLNHRLLFRALLSAALLVALVQPVLGFARTTAQDQTQTQSQPRRGRKYNPPPPTCKITVTVTKATNGKPIPNAAVVFHPMKEGKDEGNLELKTNEDGKVTIEVIPIGDTVRLQVIASGFQTFGDDYPITTDSKDIDIKMKRPARQYSIYEQHDGATQGGSDAKPQQTPPPPSTPPQ